MKWLRIFILLTLVVPIIDTAADACCAPEENHTKSVQFDACGPAVYFEAAGETSCNEDHCAQCASCNLQSFSPNAVQTLSGPLSARHHSLLNKHSYAEVVSAVLTPPPTR